MTANELYKKYESLFENKPNASIQFKNTDVCMDICCSCGEHSHIDGYFCNAVRCQYCGQAYSVSPVVKLIPIDKADESAFDEFWCGIKNADK